MCKNYQEWLKIVFYSYTEQITYTRNLKNAIFVIYYQVSMCIRTENGNKTKFCWKCRRIAIHTNFSKFSISQKIKTIIFLNVLLNAIINAKVTSNFLKFLSRQVRTKINILLFVAKTELLIHFKSGILVIFNQTSVWV